MSKPVSIGQSHNAMSALANNTDWGALDSEMLQRVVNDPKEAGRQFTAFLRNGGRMVVGVSKTVFVDRSRPFNPAKFLDSGRWSVVEEDERSLALTEVDFSKVRFETMLEKDETFIVGEKKLKRLRGAGYIRLDAKILQTLWEDKSLIPEKWKERNNRRVRYFFFDGTILQLTDGSRYVLCLYWGDTAGWCLHQRWLLNSGDSAYELSVVLES